MHPHGGAHVAARTVLLFKHTLREGAVRRGGGHASSRLVGKCDSCKASRPAANKALAGGGIRAAHCGAKAAFWDTGTAPWGPGPASADTQYLLPQASSGLPPPRHPGQGDEDAPFGRNLSPFPRRDQLIKPLPLHLTRAV